MASGCAERVIRDALWRRLRGEYGALGGVRVLDELGLCGGSALVDVAVIGEDFLHGYEIKSGRDTLARLRSQAAIYGRALHRVSVVSATNHLAGVVALVPDWWGVIEAAGDDGESCELIDRRPAEQNPALEMYALSQLLWRDEALTLLARKGMAVGVRSKPRRAVWRRLSDSVTVEELSRMVCRQLKCRPSWRELLAPEPAHSA